jgi:hypothetical protein
LTAIGAAPHLERPNFPILSRWYPESVQIALVPFGERAGLGALAPLAGQLHSMSQDIGAYVPKATA